ncbi:hypothetical protein [Streptomyces albipurpureus]|nr:hypothetical protein [Streptomyces sp. CWNU-1]
MSAREVPHLGTGCSALPPLDETVLDQGPVACMPWLVRANV